MPIFEYKCTSCKLEFERIETVIGVGKKKNPKCPQCKSPTEKLISVPGAPQFKGTGFYATDYARRRPTTD